VTGGAVFALISAASFGLMTTLAQIIYAEGGNPITFAFARSLVAALATVVICRAVGDAWRVDPPGRRAIFFVTLGQTGMSVCYLSAVAYIPVSLGAILFYLYPIAVLVIESLLHRELPGPVRIVTFLMAFAGLVFAIGPSFEQLDWRGIAFACGAVASASTMFMFTAEARRHTSGWALCFWTNGLSLIPMAVLLPVMGGFHLPGSPQGLAVLAVAIVFFALAFITYVAAVRRMAASIAALIYNAEPLVSIAAAAVLLGERLSATQAVGGALVIAALMIASWRRVRR